MRTLSELEETSERLYAAMKETKKRRYHRARELGFNAKEAVVLQNWGEEDIERLAKEKSEG